MARLVFLGCIAYLTVGLGQLVIGTVMEPMVNAYGVKYGDGGQLVLHQFAGGLAGVLLAPWLIGYVGKKALLVGCMLSVAVIEAVYALHPPWGWMLAVAPIAGFGLGTIEAVVGAFIIGAARDNANKAMSRVETFFSVGALLMPFIGYLLIASGYWKMTFAVVGAMALVSMTLWLAMWPTSVDDSKALRAAAASDRALPATGQSAGNGIAAASVPATAPSAEVGLSAVGARVRVALLACAAFFALYVGLEMSVVHYLPSLLVQNNGLSESTASLSLSVLWGAMVLGRLVAGYQADRWGGSVYLFVACLFAAAVFALMGVFDGTAVTFVLVFFAGLAMSGMFAIALVFANRAAPGRTQKTTSLLMACGGLGGALLPKVTGWFLDDYGTDATRWLFAFGALLLLAAVIWAILAVKRAAATAADGSTAV